MPQIRLDIFAHFHEAQLRKAEMEAKNRFEKMGQQAGEDITKGIEQASPKIRRAMNSAADAATDYTRRTTELTKAQQERNEAIARGEALERSIGTQYERNKRAAELVTRAENELKEARRDQSFATASVTNRDNNLRAKRAEHAETTALLAKKELELKQIRLDSGAASEQAKNFDKSLMDLRRQKADETAYIAKKESELGFARAALSDRTADAARAEDTLKEIRNEHAKGVADLDSSEQRLLKTRQDAGKADEDIIKRNDDVERSHRRRDESLRRLVESERDNDRGGGGGGGIFGGRGNGYGRGSGPLAGILPGGARASAGVYAAAAPLAGDLAMALVTASQAAAVLPAAAAAGAAGLLTLKIGFDGLGQAIKDVGDPKKFAEDLQTLGPAAQQVALEIQYLTQGPLKDLKTAVEESLFKGVPEKLHNLTNTLLPSVTQLTTGVGDAFNNMFGNFAGQLTTPESLKAIHEIINNIVTAFHNLGPAVAPFVDALTKITQTGSSFLPGFATSIANAAKSFDDFITKAQQSGALQEFMQKGVDAVKLLGQELFILGQKVYEIFGNKSPEQFKQLLDDVVNSVITVGHLLEEAGKAANAFLQWLQKIADLVGGYDQLFAIGFGIFTGAKILGVISSLSKVAGLLGAGEGGIGAGLAGIPALASAAGLALAAIALPAWIVELIKKAPYVAPDSAGAPKGVPSNQFGWAGQTPQQIYANGGLSGTLADSRDSSGRYPGEPGYTSPAGPAAPPAPPRTPSGLAGDTSHGTGLPPAPNPFGGPTPGATWPGSPDNAGLPPYHPFDVPPAPDTGPKQSQADKVRDAMSAMDPSQFTPSVPAGPIGMPGAPGPGSTQGGPDSPGPGSNQPGPLEYGTGNKPYAKPGLGYWNVNDDAVLSAKNRLDREAYDVGQARMKLQALKNVGVTIQEIRDAEEKVKEQEASYNEAYLALTKAQEGTWKKVAEDKKNNKLDKLGPGLDADFGIGGGLPGIADNLIRFVATLGMAPVLGALDVLSKGNDGKGDGGGSGILGFLGAKNLANGLSPILGRPLPDDNSPQPAYPEQTPTQNLPLGSGGGYPGDAALLANVPGGDYGRGSGDLTKGLGDCSSAVEDLVNLLDGQPTEGANVTTGNEAAWLTQRGFLPTSTPMPGTFQVGLNADHTQATLPGGTNFNYGNDTDTRNRGIAPNSGGAWDPSLTSHFYRPASGSPSGLGAGLPGGSSGATPVFVVNMPGSGFGGPPVGSPASGQGAGLPPGPGGVQPWLAQQLTAAGLSPDQAKGILAMNQVEGGATNPSSLLGFTDKQAQGPQGHLEAFMKQWNDPKRRGPGGSIPGTGPDGQVSDWNSYMNWIRQKIVGQTGAPGQPAPADYQQRLMNALGQPGPGSGGPQPGLYDPANTNPALNNPLPPTTPTGGQGGPMPTSPINPFGPPPGPNGNAYDPNLLLGGTAPGQAVGQPLFNFGAGADASGARPVNSNTLGAPGLGPVPGTSSVLGAGSALGQGLQPPTLGAGPQGPGPGAPAPPPGPGADGPVGRSSGQGGWQPAGGPGLGVGGAVGGAISAAAGAFPGIGQLAQTAMQGINRTIQYAGQLGSIGVEGLMETFLPSGSALGDPQKSWVGRVAAGLAQARPAEPTSAGQEDQKQAKQKQQQDPNAPQQQSGPMVNIENFVQAPNRNGMQVPNDIAHASQEAKSRRP